MPGAAVRRLSALLFVAGLAFGAVASGAGIDPKALVLQQSDVPSGFKLERGHRATRYLSNAAIARGDPRFWKDVAGSGRISGYAAAYENGAGAITSTGHLFRRSAGAHLYYSAAEAQQRALNAERVKRGSRAYRRRAVAVGDEATMYSSRRGPRIELILWRSGRAVAALTTWGLSRDATLALARRQQHRIAKTLG
jgi:hypothetical protein